MVIVGGVETNYTVNIIRDVTRCLLGGGGMCIGALLWYRIHIYTYPSLITDKRYVYSPLSPYDTHMIL
jgi:hypothetical protein